MPSEFARRLASFGPDIRLGLDDIGFTDPDSVYASVIAIAERNYSERTKKLKARDLAQPADWFQSEKAVGYVAYTDRFAGDLNGVAKRIPYLKSLGITYLHLMPLLQPRPGENDGGYAVMNYREVNPAIGSMKDLAELTEKLHDNEITLTIDLVLNHVAREHEWAVRAENGDPKYQAYFYVYPDRVTPDEFEACLPEVFPDFAPGNFTWSEELHAWVWTTFNSYQWDVNWSNPEVLLEYLDIIGFLANQGVDCLRLDAIAFMWKRLGTSSQNLPEVHSITQILRAFARIVAPSLIFQAEAIVGPHDIGAYLGEGKYAGKVSDVAYHNSLMVQIWSALAARDSRLMEVALNRFEALPVGTTWTTYLRCHDDIGWAIDDSDASSLGWDGFGHRSFLANFYSGGFEGSFARGEVFQYNPETGDRRISGSTASLAGLEIAIHNQNQDQINEAIDRIVLGYTIVYGFGGLPLLYMGDELGLLNDHSYRENIEESGDNRWMHRPYFPQEDGPYSTSVAQELTQRLTLLATARKALPALHARQTTRVSSTSAPAVSFVTREGEFGQLLEIYNVSENNITLDLAELPYPIEPVDLITGHSVVVTGDALHIPAFAAFWVGPA